LVTDDRLVALRVVNEALAAALDVPATPGAVVRLPFGDAHAALAAQQACRAAGVRVGCFRPPSVPEGGSCLRLTARADLTGAEVARAAEVVLSATPRRA
jgi:8-amino-7-oxononanoate synthase